MADFKVRKNPETGDVFFWEPGQSDWRQVQARRHQETGELFIYGDGDAEWRNMGVYNDSPPKPMQTESPTPLGSAPGGGTPPKVSTQIDFTDLMQAATQIPQPGALPNQPQIMPEIMPGAEPRAPVNPLAQAQHGFMPNDLLSAMAPVATPQPPQPAAADPFEGESFSDLAKRRGQQFARGASEVVASVPEALAIAGAGNPNASAQVALEIVEEARAQIEQANQRLADNPNMGAEDRQRIADVIAESRQRITAYQPLVNVAEGPTKPEAQDRDLFKAGDKVRDASAEAFGTPDPADRSFWGQVAEGAGNMTALASTVFLGPGAIPAGAGLGSAMNSSQLYKEAREAGADEDTATRAAQWGGAIGASEIIPISRALKLLPPRLRSRIGQGVMKRFADIAQGAGEEAAQEYLATVANNLVAQNIYDPERGWNEGASEAALVGAVLGGGMGAIGTAVTRGDEDPPASPVRTPEQPEPPEEDPLLEAMRETPVQQPATPQRAAPQRPQPVTPDQRPAPAAGQNVEIMDETEIVDGESVPTGRKVRVDLDTGQVSPVEEDAASTAAIPDQPRDDSVLGAEDAVADPVDIGTIRTETLSTQDVANVTADAETFQYKDNGDESGVTDRLQGVESWDERSAMGGIIYEYADGRRVVADGHQRLGLAKRLQEQGKATPWTVEVIREVDGFTPADVRRIAALKNIREGSGTAIDAAKILRESPDEIDSLNLPPKSALVRQAKGLARLSDDAFGAVVNEVVPEAFGAAVGDNVSDPALHLDVIGLLAKLKPANARQAELIAQQAGQVSQTETQTSLFGDEQVSESLYLERAKVLDGALSRISQDRRTFRVLEDRKDTITAEGNRLNSEANARKLQTDAEKQAYLQAEANRKGPISDALTDAARKLKAEPRAVKRVVGEFLDALDGIRTQPETVRPDRAAADGERSEREESVTPEPRGPEDDLLSAMGAPEPTQPRPRAPRAPARETQSPRPAARDLFDNGDDSQPGERQTDLEDLISERDDADAAEQDRPAAGEAQPVPGSRKDLIEKAKAAGEEGRAGAPSDTVFAGLTMKQIIAVGWLRDNGYEGVALDYARSPDRLQDKYRAIRNAHFQPGWPQPNSNGVYALEDAKDSASVRFGRAAKKDWRGGDTASWHVLEVAEGMWVNAASFQTAAGEGFGSPMSGPPFYGSKAEAINAAKERIRKRAEAVDSSDAAKKVAEQVIDWLGDPANMVQSEKPLNVEEIVLIGKRGKQDARLLKVNVRQWPEGYDVTGSYDVPGLSGGTIASKYNTFFDTREEALESALSRTRQLVEKDVEPRAGTRTAAQAANARKIRDFINETLKPAAVGSATTPARADDTSILTQEEQDRLALLRARFRDKAKTSINAGIDPELVAISTEMAGIYIKAGARKFRDLVRAMMEDLGLTFEQAQPYARIAYNDARDELELADQDISDMDDARAVIQAIKDMRAEGADNAPSSDASLEPDRGDADPGDTVGAADVSAARGGDGDGSTARTGAADEGSGRPAGGRRVPASDAAGVGAGRNSRVSGRDGPESGVADAGDSAGSGNRSKSRLPDDKSPDQETTRHATDASDVKDRAAQQAAADKLPIRFNDESNIRDTLPLLMEEQQNDVLLVERRFSKEDGHGMLLTNGTGTGKTYSGGGVIKRMVQAGKDNILIAAPDDGIMNAWIGMGRDMGIPISALKDTKDAGQGVVVTTYANMGANQALASRDWDMVVTDESHKLSQNATGDATKALNTLRIITNRPADRAMRGYMVYADEWQKMRAMPDSDERSALAGKLREKNKALAEKYESKPRSKVLFLSATPFSYDKTLDYAEGYLFDYGAGGTTDSGSRQEGRAFFFVENFGYRIRYHKLTKPEGAVDNAVFEREMHERLKREGALAGRSLTVSTDYDRKFVSKNSALGDAIDAAFKYLWDKQGSKKDPKGEWSEVQKHINRGFKYHDRMQLLEQIKAELAVDDIRKHMEMGRKVVVFHDFNKGGGKNPFSLSMKEGDKGYAQYQQFLSDNPVLAQTDFGAMRSPLQAMRKEFGDRAVFYNGTETKQDRRDAIAAFNDDASGVDLVVVQADAGSAGISLHDTTGKHQRVLINLGMPPKPTTALQEEGRIRRVGVVTNAPFRYYTIGTTWERSAFADKIAGRSGTVENLALGNDARAIRDSFIDAYTDADINPPSDSDGTGGMERDRVDHTLSEFDKAKTHYYGRLKNTAKRSQRKGVDFFATPEPLGLKMVEWAGMRANEKALEPSVGDGAIGRYFPDFVDSTIVDPSMELLSKARLRVAGARAEGMAFEDLHVVNKFDTVVMNPPFGHGGKLAFDHVAKALKHTRPGGRVVALVPTGPAADKQFSKVMDEFVFGDRMEFNLTAEIALPSATFERAGTSVSAKVMVIDRVGSLDDRTPTQRINLRGADTVEQFFERLEAISVPARPAPVAEPGAIADAEGDIETLVEKLAPPTLEDGGSEAFETFEFENTKSGLPMFGAQVKEKLGDRFKEVVAVAKSHGGYYSRYQNKEAGAKRGFLFPSEAERQAFMDDLQKPTIAKDQAPAIDETIEQGNAALWSVMPALRAELDRLNLKRVNMVPDAPGADRQGGFHMNRLGRMDVLIGASLNPEATLHHEAIHAMKAMGLFTSKEWRALEIEAARKWVEKHDIAKRYPDLLPSEQIEEAIADEFSEFASKDRSPGSGLIAQAYAKVRRLVTALANALRGGGFQTAEDVFGRAYAGEIGARDAASTGFQKEVMKDARGARRATSAQARAHAATTMMGHSAFIPSRGIWDELVRQNRGVFARLRGAAAAANDHVDRARIKVQDRFLPVLRAQEAIVRHTGKALPEEQNAYLSEETFSGKVGRHLFEIDEDYTKPIIDLMAGQKGEESIDPDMVGTWLYARHAQERNAQIASINLQMPDGGSGMTNTEARDILNDAANGPYAARLKKIGQMVDDLRERTLALREDAGLITNQEATLWRNQYRHYVPLKGFADTEHSEAFLDVAGVGRRFNTKGAETRRALGRESEAFNPLQAALTQAQEVAIRAEKNRVGQALFRLARQNPAPNLWEIKTPKQKRFYNRTTGLVETRSEDPLSLFMEPNEMAVKVNGKEHRVLFNDNRLAMAAGSVGADQMGWFIGLMSKAARWFSSVNTMLDPEFVIRNAFRDMTAAQINIRNFGKDDRNALAKAMIKNWPKAFVGAYRGQVNAADTEWTKYYREFDKSGAKVSFWKLEQPEAEKEDLERRVKMAGGNMLQRSSRFVRISTRDNPILGFIERTNLAVDNAVRLAAYVEARKQGWSKAEAASLSKNLTVNFNRRGEWGSTVNALYPFANAGLQGTQILFRAMTSKRMAKYAVGLVAMGAILDQVNAMLSEEDDDGELAYDKIPDWKNQMNLTVMLGPEAGSAATLWLPYGYNLFPYLGQQASKVARGVKQPTEVMGDFAAAMFGSFSPLGGRDFQSVITPTMLDPINEMAMNEDWLGRPIRPENPWSDYGPDAYKYYGSVSSTSKAISDALNRATGGTIAEPGVIDVSPEYIDHGFGFVTGGAGRFVGRSTDTLAKLMRGEVGQIESRNIPFYRSLQYQTGDWLDRERYYRFRDEVKSARDYLKTYQEVGAAVPEHVRRKAGLYKMISESDKQLRGARSRKNVILERDDMDPEQRSRALKRIEDSSASVYLRFNKVYLQRMGSQGE